MLKTLVLCLFASPALATPLVPPSQFDHQYKGQIAVIEVKKQNVYGECGNPDLRRDVAGCAWVSDNGDCIIIVATKSPRANKEEIFQHEQAHCNGWRHE